MLGREPPSQPRKQPQPGKAALQILCWEAGKSSGHRLQLGAYCPLQGSPWASHLAPLRLGLFTVKWE